MKPLSITNVNSFTLEDLTTAISTQLLDDELPVRIEMLDLATTFELIQSIGSKQSLTGELCAAANAELAFWKVEKQGIKVNNTQYDSKEIEKNITFSNHRVEMLAKAFSALDKKYNCLAKMIRIVEQSK